MFVLKLRNQAFQSCRHFFSGNVSTQTAIDGLRANIDALRLRETGYASTMPGTVLQAAMPSSKNALCSKR
jgi:hypothetical protein